MDLWVHDISPPSALVVDRRTRRALGVGDRHRRGSPPRMAGGGGGGMFDPFCLEAFRATSSRSWSCGSHISFERTRRLQSRLSTPPPPLHFPFKSSRMAAEPCRDLSK